jgi:hypothetical protein
MEEERERQLFFSICVPAKEREREGGVVFFPVLFLQMRRGNTDRQRRFFFPPL